jgi:hypothetical protein
MSQQEELIEPTRYADFISGRLAALHKTQHWFALHIGMKPSQVSMLIRGKWSPTKDWATGRIPRMATLLKCNRGELKKLIENALLPHRGVTTAKARAGRKPINQAILRALSEEVVPHQDLLWKLINVEHILAAPLSYETCKALLKDARLADSTDR